MNIIGIDYGYRHVGVAFSRNGTIKPLFEASYIKNHLLENELILKISKVVKEEYVKLVVIGLPLIDNEENQFCRDVREFGNKLKRKLVGVDVVYVSEMKTSIYARKKAVKYNISKKSRKKDHKYAATMIIKNYLTAKSS